MKTGIEWTDATWNPVIGCTPVSPGCLNCYAATMAHRLQHVKTATDYAPRQRVNIDGGPGDYRLEGVWCRCGGEVWYQDMWRRGKANKEWRWEAFCRVCKSCDCNGYSSIRALKSESPKFWGDHRTIRIAEVKNGRAVFTGEVRCLPHKLDEPLHWRAPRRVFVNSMSDLFHESVPFDFIDSVFALMALCPRHTFQVLTKRPERMAEYLGDDHSCGMGHRIAQCAREMVGRSDLATWVTGLVEQARDYFDDHEGILPNVWLGTSVENQATADERIPHLLRCPAAVRFLSCEPLLGPIDISPPPMRGSGNWLGPATQSRGMHHGADWVIVGGESGAKARPCDVGCIRGVVRQCQKAGVPVFVKQVGALPYCDSATAPPADLQMFKVRLLDPKGGDPAEWPSDLRVRQWPEVAR